MKLLIGVFLVMAGVAGVASSSNPAAESSKSVATDRAQTSPRDSTVTTSPQKSADDAVDNSDDRIAKPEDDSKQAQPMTCDVAACDSFCTLHGHCAGICETGVGCHCFDWPDC
jgi:hypothetical protein